MDKRTENHDASIEQVKKWLRDLQYGSVTLVVQDNYIVQIEKSEKIRLK